MAPGLPFSIGCIRKLTKRSSVAPLPLEQLWMCGRSKDGVRARFTRQADREEWCDTAKSESRELLSQSWSGLPSFFSRGTSIVMAGDFYFCPDRWGAATRAIL